MALSLSFYGWYVVVAWAFAPVFWDVVLVESLKLLRFVVDEKKGLLLCISASSPKRKAARWHSGHFGRVPRLVSKECPRTYAWRFQSSATAGT